MDRIEWLYERVEQAPEDAQGWYFLAQELLIGGQIKAALQALSEGLKYADDTLRPQLIAEIAKVSDRLQQPAAGAVETPYEPPYEPQMGRLHVINGGAEGKKNATPAQKKITFADVGGLQELKKTIDMKIIKPFFNQGLFAKFKKKTGGGVLLYGPPGCGKTFMAQATAGEIQAEFINVHITDILDGHIGDSEKNILRVFDRAREQKPCVVFFDEIDAIGFNRSKAEQYLRPVVDTFLSELEGMGTSLDQILFIGATNVPWDVDAAFKRPGRFDRMVFVAPPDPEAREAIFRLKLEGRPVGELDLPLLAKQTEYFSGADIENVVERAAEYVLEEILSTGQERVIEMGDLLRVLREVQPSTLEWLRTVKNYVRYANQDGMYQDVEAYLKRQGRRV